MAINCPFIELLAIGNAKWPIRSEMAEEDSSGRVLQG